jgi:Baseplate J-like protein
VKTQIIQLNQNDDSISIREKISWNQTGRILLVWPVKGTILMRQLDLMVVNRHALSQGAQLALVTHDPEVGFYARQMGIPVFRHLRHTKDHPWKNNRPASNDQKLNSHQNNLDKIRENAHPTIPERMDYPVIRILSLGFSIFVVFALIVFILPSAKVILSPQMEIQSMRFDLFADPSISSINLSTGHLPTYSKEVIVDRHDTITSTGSMFIPDDPALGKLKFTNISKNVIHIPEGTIVATTGIDPVRFITTSSGIVTINPNTSIIVSTRALKPGISGNLSRNTLVIIEGNQDTGLSVTNPVGTQGGTDATFPSPTMQDLQSLRAQLYNQLEQAALINLQSMLPDGDTIITPTLSMIETLDESFMPSIGEPSNQLELNMRLRFECSVVSSEVIRNLVTPILDSNTPLGYSPVIDSLEITPVVHPSLGQDGIAHWTVSAVRKVQVVIQPNQVTDLIKGEMVTNAKEQLSASLPLMEQAHIILAPSWWPRLPFLTMRIWITQVGIP